MLFFNCNSHLFALTFLPKYLTISRELSIPASTYSLPMSVQIAIDNLKLPRKEQAASGSRILNRARIVTSMTFYTL